LPRLGVSEGGWAINTITGPVPRRPTGSGWRTSMSPIGALRLSGSPAPGAMRKGKFRSAQRMAHSTARSIALPATSCTTRQPSRASLIERSIARPGAAASR